MSDPIRVSSALAVLLSGLVALSGSVFGDRDGPAGAQAPLASQARALTLELPAPHVNGLDPAIQSVLETNGKLDVVPLDQLTMFPPEVARVLVAHGATLTVDESSGNTP